MTAFRLHAVLMKAYSWHAGLMTTFDMHAVLSSLHSLSSSQELRSACFTKMTQNGLKWILNTTFEKSRLTLIILSVVLVAGSKFNDS